MSFREKTAWIALVAHGAVYGVYFLIVARSWNEGVAEGRVPVGLLFATVLALVVISVVLVAIAAIAAPKEANAPVDERERMIELRAIRIAWYVLVTGVMGAMLALLIGWNAFQVINVLLAAIVVAELASALSQIVQFRAGS